MNLPANLLLASATSPIHLPVRPASWGSATLRTRSRHCFSVQNKIWQKSVMRSKNLLRVLFVTLQVSDFPPSQTQWVTKPTLVEALNVVEV